VRASKTLKPVVVLSGYVMTLLQNYINFCVNICDKVL